METKAQTTPAQIAELSPTQIENWRKALYTTLGPYALIMPAEQVQAMRNKMQDELNKLGESK